MHRKEIILILGIVLLAGTACSSLRIGNLDRSEGNYTINSGKLVDNVAERNIVAGPVAINKISIKYSQDQESRRLRAYLRYNGNDSILLSIRTFAGIEAARALITGDSVWVLDKINKVVYTGNNKRMEEKYGVNYDMIKMLFGDISELDITERKLRCREGVIMVKEDKNNEMNEYIIDCNLYKLLQVKSYRKDGNLLYSGKFSEFADENGLIYPERIIWDMDNENIQLEISISNIRKRDRIAVNFVVPEYYDRGKI